MQAAIKEGWQKKKKNVITKEWATAITCVRLISFYKFDMFG